MANIPVIQLSKTGQSGSWLTLPTPTTLKPSINALHSSKSGRDNNTGMMFIDKITDKAKYTVSLPQGMTDDAVAQIIDILLEPSFYAQYPSIRSGGYVVGHFYCSSVDVEILKMTSTTKWTCKAWSFNMTEM